MAKLRPEEALNELIRIENNTDGIQTVNARHLHSFLEVGRKFNGWILGRISDYGFQSGVDFTEVRSQTGPALNRSRVEYFLTLDMAKELAMVERTEKGRQARRYFIAVEKRFQEVSGSEWLAARNQGKLVRQIVADKIADFIEYAKSQGSQSAEMYFVNFSKMVNSALLEIDGPKPKNLRDSLNSVQLNAISVAENIIARSLSECMAKRLPYKDSFQIAKKQIQTYAGTVGRTKLGQSDRQSMGLLA